MSAHHEHGHHHHDHALHGADNIRMAFFLNLAFTVIEIAGGLWTNSIAVLSDAVHDLGDSLSLGLAWYFHRMSARGRTPQHTYGYRRYALLGGLITGIVLVAGVAFILWNAVHRLLSPEPVNAPGMLLLAVVGILFNGAALIRVRRGSSLTEQIVSWHLLEDVLGWAAVLVGAAVMAVWDAPLIDPVLSIGISLFILWNVVRNLRRVFDVFLQRVPKTFDTEEFERAMLAVGKVIGIHHTHIWSIDGENHVLTTHLVMAGDAGRDDILRAKLRLQELIGKERFEHITVEVELEGEECITGGGHHGAEHEARHPSPRASGPC